MMLPMQSQYVPEDLLSDPPQPPGTSLFPADHWDWPRDQDRDGVSVHAAAFLQCGQALARSIRVLFEMQRARFMCASLSCERQSDLFNLFITSPNSPCYLTKTNYFVQHHRSGNPQKVRWFPALFIGCL